MSGGSVKCSVFDQTVHGMAELQGMDSGLNNEGTDE